MGLQIQGARTRPSTKCCPSCVPKRKELFSLTEPSSSRTPPRRPEILTLALFTVLGIAFIACPGFWALEMHALVYFQNLLRSSYHSRFTWCRRGVFALFPSMHSCIVPCIERCQALCFFQNRSALAARLLQRSAKTLCYFLFSLSQKGTDLRQKSIWRVIEWCSEHL